MANPPIAPFANPVTSTDTGKVPLPTAYTPQYLQQKKNQEQQQAILQKQNEEQKQAAAEQQAKQQALQKKYENGSLSKGEFNQLFGNQFEQKYGNKGSDATDYAYYKYKVSKGQNLSQDEERNFAYAGISVGKSIRSDLGGGLNKISIGAKPSSSNQSTFQENNYSPTLPVSKGAPASGSKYNSSGFNLVGSSVRGKDYFLTGGTGEAYQIPYTPQKGGKEIIPFYKEKKYGYTNQAGIPINYETPLPFSKGQPTTKNNYTTTTFPKSTNNFFDIQEAKKTSIDYLAPKIGKDFVINGKTGRAPRIFFPEIGITGLIEFGTAGALTGGFSKTVERGTEIESKNFGFDENQTMFAKNITNFGLSIAAFTFTGKITNSFSKKFFKIEKISIKSPEAISTPKSGLVGSGTGSSLVEGKVFVTTKYSIPFEKNIPNLFSEKAGTPFQLITKNEAKSFLTNTLTTSEGGEISTFFNYEKKPIKAPEKIVEPFTSNVYKENLISSAEKNAPTTFLPLTAEGKAAKANLSSQAEVVKSEISVGSKTNFNPKFSERTSLDTSEFVVKETGELSIRGKTFRSKTFPFNRITRTDVNPKRVAYGGTSIQSTKSLQEFILQKQNREFTRIRDSDLPNQYSTFQGLDVKPFTINETIVNETTTRKGFFTSSSSSGTFERVKNPFTEELVGYNISENSPKLSPTLTQGNFSQKVFKRSFESGERTGLEFGTSKSRLSGKIGDIKYSIQENVFLRGKESFLERASQRATSKKELLTKIENRKIVSTDFGEMRNQTLRELGVIPKSSYTFSPKPSIKPSSLSNVLTVTSESPKSVVQTPSLSSKIISSVLTEKSFPVVSSSSSKIGFILSAEGPQKFFGEYVPKKFVGFNQKGKSLSGVSLYKSQVGKNLFANASQKNNIKVKPVSISLNSSLTQPLTRPIAKPLTRGISTPITRPVTRPITRPLTFPLTIPKQTHTTIPLTTPLTRPITQPLSIPITVPLTQPISRPIIRPFLGFPGSTPFIPRNPKQKGSLQRKDFGPGFSFLFRTKGKTKLYPGSFTERDALAVSNNFLRNTLRASRKVVRVGGIATPKYIQGPSLSGYTNKKGFFVQARGTRLGSRGERREIQGSRKRKRGLF